RDQQSLRTTVLGGERRLVEPGDDLESVLRALGEPPPEAAFTARGRRAARPREYFAHQRVVHRSRGAGRAAVAAEAPVAVVSRGDDALLELGGRPAWHFPQTPDGVYAGHHPADGPAAVAHLEAMRARGGRYLVLPSTAFWWLDHYP